MTDSKPYHSRIEVYKGNREELLGRFKPGATQGGVRRAMSAWQGCGYLEDSEGFTVTFACRDAAQGIYSFYAGLALSRNANVSTDKHADKMVELGQLADDLREEYRELQTQMTDLIKQLKAETRRHKPD